MSLRLGPVAATLLSGALLSACNLPHQATPEATPAPLPPPATETQSGCPPSSLVSPAVVAPETQISESLRPTFEWSYAGDCPPDEFRIEVAPGGDFDNPATVVGTASAAMGSWTPADDLQPATHFVWRVASVSAGMVGPFSALRDIWTGPSCAGADLQPPQLLSPSDGAYLEDPSPILDFDYPTGACLQEWFSIDVSADPDFSTEALHATVGPSTEFDTNLDYLADCTLYYWRAKAVYGEDISGPYSAVSAFYADFRGDCAPHTGLPRISGVIWADSCPATGSPSPNPPPGCVWQEGGLAPDGVRQDTEEAIAGLLVRIAPGACTAPGIGWTTGPTDEMGHYTQVVIPGTYCVWAYRDRDGNQAILGSGRWTHPPGGYDSPVRYEIQIDWGEERMELDFGWVFLP